MELSLGWERAGTLYHTTGTLHLWSWCYAHVFVTSHRVTNYPKFTPRATYMCDLTVPMDLSSWCSLAGCVSVKDPHEVTIQSCGSPDGSARKEARCPHWPTMVGKIQFHALWNWGPPAGASLGSSGSLHRPAYRMAADCPWHEPRGCLRQSTGFL